MNTKINLSLHKIQSLHQLNQPSSVSHNMFLKNPPKYKVPPISHLWSDILTWLTLKIVKALLVTSVQSISPFYI